MAALGGGTVSSLVPRKSVATGVSYSAAISSSLSFFNCDIEMSVRLLVRSARTLRVELDHDDLVQVTSMFMAGSDGVR